MERKLTDEQAARVEQFDLNVEKVEALLARAGKEVDDGLLPAAQLAIAREGEVVLQQSYGSAQDDSLTCVFSATKAITSAAAWLLFQQHAPPDQMLSEILLDCYNLEKQMQ